MSVRKAYSEWATTYDQDRNLTRDLDERVMRESLGQRRYTSILELGCGTGKNTRLLIQRADRVVALDFSEGMITRARAKLRADSVLFAVANLTQTWPCADQSIDLVVCNLVLEHINDLGFIFAQAQRILTPGGHFFVCELHPFRQYQGKKAIFQGEGGQVEIPAFVHHVSDFLNAAEQVGFALKRLGEWWHEDDQQLPPRLISCWFEKKAP
jgi:malonyl-CoA O-methyltransferase